MHRLYSSISSSSSSSSSSVSRVLERFKSSSRFIVTQDVTNIRSKIVCERYHVRSIPSRYRTTVISSSSSSSTTTTTTCIQPLLSQTYCTTDYDATHHRRRISNVTYHTPVPVVRHNTVIRWNSTTVATPTTSSTSSRNSSSSSSGSSTMVPPNNNSTTTSLTSTSYIDDSTGANQSPSTVDATLTDESSSSTTTSTTDIHSTIESGTMREKIRDRIQDTRTAAVAQMKEFRDHPGQSAKDGAKTFSGMLRKYGPIFVGTYGCVYFTTLGLLFSGVQSGILDPLALFQYLGSHNPSEHGAETATTVHLVVDWMVNHDITKPYAPYVEENPAFANFAVAWIAVKFTEPVRLPIALALTPRVSRFIGYTTDTPSNTTTTTGTPEEKVTPTTTTEDTTVTETASR